MSKKQKVLLPVEQSERFKETARKIGADERPEAFDESFKGIATTKPAVVRSRPSAKRSGS